MAFAIEQEQQGAVRILALSGRLDTETAADLELALQDLQAAGANQFLIDMAAIGYVSSAGLRVLLALAKQLDGGRGSLRLCGLNAAVMQVFDVAGFSKLFLIYPDRQAALGLPVAAPVVDNGLARSAATLLGAPQAAGESSSGSADLARAAAQLLGASASAKKSAEAGDKKAEAVDKKGEAVDKKQKAAAAPAAKPAQKQTETAHAAAPGMLGKLRNLFGKK